jgi:hypothetical protein
MNLNAEDDNISFVSSHSLIGTGAAAATGGNTTANTTSVSSTKHRILGLANELLSICNADPNNKRHLFGNLDTSSARMHIPSRLVSTRQLTSTVFVYFFESICDSELVDKKWPPRCLEDEIHNIQSVIDSISLDILHEDLSHLTGEAICGSAESRPDLVSIEYLLDILRCIHEWIASRIESENCSIVQTNHQQGNNSQSSRSKNQFMDAEKRHLATITNTITVSGRGGDSNQASKTSGSSNKQPQVESEEGYYQASSHYFCSEPNQKYNELSQRFEQTVKMTHEALALNEDEESRNNIDLEDLIETVNTRLSCYTTTNRGSDYQSTSGNAFIQNNQDDIFRKYMEQKEREYRSSRQNQNYSNSAINIDITNEYEDEVDESRPISIRHVNPRVAMESNSVNSTLTSSSAASFVNEPELRQTYQQPQYEKHVKFNIAGSRNASDTVGGGGRSVSRERDPIKSK